MKAIDWLIVYEIKKVLCIVTDTEVLNFRFHRMYDSFDVEFALLCYFPFFKNNIKNVQLNT
jgi:hypothetical protein